MYRTRTTLKHIVVPNSQSRDHLQKHIYRTRITPKNTTIPNQPGQKSAETHTNTIPQRQTQSQKNTQVDNRSKFLTDSGTKCFMIFAKGMLEIVLLFCQNIHNCDKRRSFYKSFAWCWCPGCMPFHVSPQITRLCACVIAFVASKVLLTSELVPPQLACFPESETALIARKRFFSGMQHHVCHEMTSIVGWIVALVTPEALLPWMCCHVLFECTWPWERRFTLGAMKCFFPWVSEQVPLENIWRFAGEVTLFAMIWLCSWMDSGVLLELTCCCAGIFTLFARKRLSPWMSARVPLKIICRCAGIVALFTTKRLFSWVGSHVDSKTTRLVARVVTLWTNKWFFSAVNHRVGSEVNSLCARVVALWTNKGLLSTVNSHVSFQLGRCLAWVAALVAIVTFLCRILTIVEFYRAGHFWISWFLMRAFLSMSSDDWCLKSYFEESTCKKWKLRTLCCKMRALLFRIMMMMKRMMMMVITTYYDDGYEGYVNI